MATESVPIPSPPGLPLIGHAAAFDSNFPLGTLLTWADNYGEIFRVNILGRSSVVISSQRLAHEVSDESRFEKVVGSGLEQVRNGIHDGLFSARSDEPNWGVAHRVLVPAFGPLNILDMFAEMHDIATQLALKWARNGPNVPIQAADDFTRLALDAIALCSMNYRFNSFYHDEQHPFVQAMTDFLSESGNRSRRPAYASVFLRQAEKKYWEDIEVLQKTARGVLDERKANPMPNRKDLLRAMLDGVDPKTGKKLGEQSIMDNLITFLIAGHETTSGSLAFAFYNLLTHPEAYRKAQLEVDQVCGKGPITAEHLSKLKYIPAVLRETLRVTSAIPQWAVTSKEDTIIGGKYAVKKGQSISVLLKKLHTDATVWGETAAEFIPERMLDEPFEQTIKAFPDCWKPWGNGMRGCIGRPFAWQEMLLVTCMLLQNFNFVSADPAYKLEFQQNLTIKPKNFYMRAVLRDGMSATELESRLAGRPAKSSSSDAAEKKKTVADTGADTGLGKNKEEGKPLSIYYGSNTGTCEALAQRLASDASAHGFSATVVEPLDMANQNLPRDRPVAIITASYEGLPADNAKLFCGWVESLKEKELEGVDFAVFSCGHRDWARTFHKVPRMLDATLEARGGARTCPAGLTDTADATIFTDFETWEDEQFWPAMQTKYYGAAGKGAAAAAAAAVDKADTFATGIEVEFSSPRSSTLRQDVKEALVVENKVITGPGVPVKKHIEISLPSEMSYTSGDYLAVLPMNPKENVARVMRRFGLAWDTQVTIKADRPTQLPVGSRVSVADVLGAYVELAQPATKRIPGSV